MYDFNEVKEESQLTRYEYKQHLENNVNIKDRDGETYNFHIKDINDYIHYCNGFIVAKVKILKQDGTDVGVENVAFVNTANLFDRATLLISNTRVEEVIYPGVAQQVIGLVNFSEDYANGSEATNMMFYKDTSEKANRNVHFYAHDNPLPMATVQNIKDFLKYVVPNKEFNKGFTHRWNLTKNGRTAYIWIPLRQYFGIFNSYRKLFTGIDVKIELSRNNSANMLLTDSNEEFKVSFLDLVLYLPHAELKAQADIEYLEQISQDIELDFESINLVKSNVQNNISGRYLVNTSSNDVQHVYVVPMHHEKQDNIRANNMTFNNLKLKRTNLRINNTRYPEENYHVSFQNDQNWGRYYMDFLSGGKKNDGSTEVGSLVSFEEYKNLYPIIHFDVSAHKILTGTDTLKIEFEWDLETAPEKPYVFYFIIIESRKAIINMQKKQFQMLCTI